MQQTNKLGITLAILMLNAIIFCEGEDLKDFLVNEGDKKGYKIMYTALPWEDAIKSCENEGFSLAVPKTQKQFDFIQKVVRSMNHSMIEGTNDKLLTWVGISNKENHLKWRNIDGENIMKSEFHKWAEGNGFTSTNPKEPHCAGVDAFNHGLRNYWCDHRQPYICETQIIDTMSGKLRKSSIIKL